MQPKRLLLNMAVFAAMTVPAHAVQTVADSVTENQTPPIVTNLACVNDVGVTSDGSTDKFVGYCPQETTPASYEISFNYSLGLDERMKSITIWANAGNGYSDGELQTFDLKVDYIDDNGNPATLVMNGVDIGDTLNENDPKTVLFTQSGSPVELRAVSHVRISNIGGPTGERAIREVQGDVNPDPASATLAVTKTASPNTNVDAGTDVTYTYVVKNTGNQPITNISLNDVHDGLGNPKPVPGNETLSADKGLSNDSSDLTANDGVWDTLAPFDEITLTATYKVTYRDIEDRQ